MSLFQHMGTVVDLKLLEVVLERFVPRSAQVLNILKLKLQNRFTSESSVEFYVFRKSNNSEEDFTDPFLLIVQKPNIWTQHGIFILAPDIPTSEMLASFELFIDWKKDTRFCSSTQAFADKYLKTMCKRNGAFTVNPEHGIPCESHMCSPNLALSFFHEAEDVVLRPLETRDIQQVLRSYPYKTPYSERQLELSIENLTSCGLYVEGVLASWAILASSGLINILHTEEAYRRRGYGLLVIKALTKQIAQMGLTPLVETEIHNVASKVVVTKAGFQHAGYTNWLNI